MHVQLTPRYH